MVSGKKETLIMTLWILIVECLAIAVPFSLMVVIMLNKDPVNMIVNYPPEIQAEYYRSQGFESKKQKLTAKKLHRKGNIHGGGAGSYGRIFVPCRGADFS